MQIFVNVMMILANIIFAAVVFGLGCGAVYAVASIFPDVPAKR